MRKESLYAPLLALGLVVTKESIKPAHNLAGEVCQKKLRETKESTWCKETFTQKTL